MQRLKKRSEFLAAARAGRAAMLGLVMQARTRGDEDPPRFGFTASKKVGNAVARNRAKRRLRAAIDQISGTCARPGIDYVLIARAATVDLPYGQLTHDMKKAIEQLHRRIDKSDAGS